MLKIVLINSRRPQRRQKRRNSRQSQQRRHTITQLIPESTGNNINCLSAHKIAKLCSTSSQLRENLPMEPSLKPESSDC